MFFKTNLVEADRYIRIHDENQETEIFHCMYVVV